MMCLRSVSFVALASLVGAIAHYSVGNQTSTQATPAMQQGVSVEMAVTNYAAPMPAADDGNAWIVTVTENGSMYFGINPVTPASLEDAMKSHPRNRQQMLYIKSDARAPFAKVQQVLEAASEAGFEAPVLLTSQLEPSRTGTIVSPKGLEVWVGSPTPSDSRSAVVRVFSSNQPLPALVVDDQRVPWSGLQSTLDQTLQNRRGKTVVVEADGQLQYAQVVHVIDVCHSAGARVVLSAPEL
jgi:biopolymer transport protein ExbD